MSSKRLKDPLYGYISIPNDIMYGIVDTAAFQRLRRVTQTSYSPLYSSAVHNRFVHSLGVYHLGEMAAETLVRQMTDILREDNRDTAVETLQKLKKIFCLACLLHDVGHAPFSHTGEKFYLENCEDYSKLHALLIEAVSTDSFGKDVPKAKSSAAAPHEIMSSIVGIREFGSFMPETEDREFFARCITGYIYQETSSFNSIRNCFIQLLNSKVIDVDKLDYLIRDAYITGFCTVNIDYQRLLTSLTIVDKNESGAYELAYFKSAISVIENVVYAHDSERKWIQNHPVILYESYILQHVMRLLSEKLDTGEKKLFSIDALSKGGQTLQSDMVVRLLSDDDIISLMKQYYYENDLVSEYFERNTRRHPVWKSESEYKAFFLGISEGGTLLASLESALEVTAEYLSKNTTNWVINQDLIDTINRELKQLDGLELDEASKKAQRKDKEKILKVVGCLSEYATSKQYDCDFVLLKTSQFNSGFSKPNFSETNIVFPTKGGRKAETFKKTASSISGVASGRDNFFYIFYKRKPGEIEPLDAAELCSRLFAAFV